MRVVSMRDFATNISGESARRMMVDVTDVILVMVDMCGEPVRFMTKISTLVQSQWCRRAMVGRKMSYTQVELFGCY
jgi:hypothetical protein